MQLSKIKLAGFKSFVDPTTIMLPSKMVAIVGPNGCGKSNIIDAVSWVMGESSPKYLRGESLTDVIFNGSTARKPVGQASVELVFDNQDGTLGGEYAKFAEISIKRVLTRESDAAYFLNGVRCRKRDVVDIFLGTGLGSRSYSIIGQNMINRVVEAKPEELRTYFEEAAGISKYKERRHETELRIHHTKENLARVNDLRGELEKQLGHLQHQANVAERFKTLKQQERTLRAEWYVCQWRQFDGRIIHYTLEIQKEETALEARHTELSSIERELEQRRHDQHQAQQSFQEVQKKYYAIGNEITRVEQDILHHQERQHQWQEGLQGVEKDCAELNNHLSEALENLTEVGQEIESLEPRLTAANTQEKQMSQQLAKAEETLQGWQARWDEFNLSASKTTQIAHVAKTNIQHLEQKVDALQKRQEQLKQEQGVVDFEKLNKELDEFSKKSGAATDAIESQDKALTDIRDEINNLQATQKQSNFELDRARSELQQLKGQQASLEALQQTALGQRDNPASAWIAKHHLEKQPRLAQGIEVEAGWELAVEKVLGFCLQAICVDKIADLVAHVDDFKIGNLCVFTSANDERINNKSKGVSLLEKIKSESKLDSLMHGIYVSESIEDAMKLCKTLSIHESVITKDGIWLNKSWLKILREQNPAAGVFHREQELKLLTKKINERQQAITELEKSISDRQEKMTRLESEREKLREVYNQQQAQSAQIVAQQKAKQERLAELKAQAERYAKEFEECVQQYTKVQNELAQTRSAWQEANAKLENHEQLRQSLVNERDVARREVQTLRENTTRHKEHIHELEIRIQTNKSQKSSLEQNKTRLETQLATLSERKDLLESELNTMLPLDEMKKTLSLTLDKHVNIETDLTTSRAAVDAINQEFRNLEEKRQFAEKEANKIRHKLESLRVECQGWKVKVDTINEQMKEANVDLESVLKELPPELAIEECQAKVDQIAQRIHRLGPINLIAIEEYATCLERKQYLDKQVEDLDEGLRILEDAIGKIDKETRTRFKETFDKVNERFQELFPSIFGGGRAYLELTSDNLLEAGATVMACPPGKRNSTIHLLSGGEKALTAIALIFSIFHLNPAPFCLLDEVDAALDDANVVRFCRLVKAMAGKTQFFFISHNKVTIEMGEHLIGVTMNEPGVSRLVSVDIENAMSFAGVK